MDKRIKPTFQKFFLLPFILSLLHLFIKFTEHLLYARRCSERWDHSSEQDEVPTLRPTFPWVTLVISV